MANKKVGVIVGSLRKESLNRKMAKALTHLLPSLDFEFIEIGDLALYNEDLEENVPHAWSEFRLKVASMSALLFVSPEYNRTVPGALKNAIDVGSRPMSNNVWKNKPAAVITVSPGAPGGLAANMNIRIALTPVGMALMPIPEAYIGNAKELFNADGTLVPKTNDYMKTVMDAFDKWVSRNA